MLAGLPKDIIREESESSHRLKGLCKQVLMFFKRLDDTLCSVENSLTHPFKDRLLLENMKLLSQLFLERYISIKEKETNPLVSYFKGLFDRINVRSAEQTQEQNRKRDIEFI